MNNFLDTLQKLRGRSLDELRARGTQFLAAQSERRRLSTQTRVPGDRRFLKSFTNDFASRLKTKAAGESSIAAHLLAHFRARTAPHFFASFDDREATVNEWRKLLERKDAARILQRANAQGEGRFDLLGFRNLFFGEPIDWHLEPVARKRAPLIHWSEIDFLDPNVAGDKKIIWELNRCQHFVTLGRAYWLTNDERYAEIFAAQIQSWMRANPPKMGINWASNLEVALRAIAWIWSLYFLKDSKHLTPQLFTRILKFLYLHARHLETYLSVYFSPNTHLTGEALGLFYLGTIFPEFKRARVWRETGLKILTDALQWQVRDDGVYFEQTSYYARYTADFYTHLFILAERNAIALPEIVRTKLELLLEHLMYIMRPDGTTPFYGDDDGGRLLILDERPANDFRAALSNGATLFWRGDFKFVAGEAAEETLWLCGAKGVAEFGKIEAREPRSLSKEFKESGYFVMRDSWRRDANFLLIDCGIHGEGRSCGHAHADALSVDLSIKGQQIFVDAGTFTYTASRQKRNLFRSTSAHNTLTIDNEPQSVPSEQPFKWETIAQTQLKAWRAHERFDYFAGAQNGYERLKSPAVHTRSVLFLKGDYFILRDTVKTEGAHRYALNFHCAPELKTHFPVGIKSDAWLMKDSGEIARDFVAQYRVSAFESHGRGAWRMSEGFVSPCYGAIEKAEILSFYTEARGNLEFVSFMLTAREAAREITARNGRAFEIESDLRTDLLLIGGGKLIETAGVASDGEWCWVRLTRGEPTEILMLNGSQIVVSGALDFRAPGRALFLVAKRSATKSNEWRIETNAADYKFRLARKPHLRDETHNEMWIM